MKNDNTIEVIQNAILRIFSFLGEKYYYEPVCKTEQSNVFEEYLKVEYVEKIKRRSILISYSKMKIQNDSKLVFSASIMRLPVNGEEDYFSLTTYMNHNNLKLSTTLSNTFEKEQIEEILYQLKNALIDNAIEIIEGKLWLENYYPRRF